MAVYLLHLSVDSPFEEPTIFMLRDMVAPPWKVPDMYSALLVVP